MTIEVRIDGQGRVVIPQRERERLDLKAGEVLVLVPTPEGMVLERRRRATVSRGPDGLPIVTFDRPRPVSNEESLDAIRAARERE